MEKRHSIIAIVMAILFLVTFVACGVSEQRVKKKTKDLLEELQEHSFAYNRMIVWQDLDGASAAVLPEKRIQFLEQAQEIASKVRIENFSIPLCQVSLEPIPRDKDIDLKPSEDSTLKPTKDEIKTAPSDERTEEATEDTKKKKKAKKKKPKIYEKMPTVFYGVALVRYFNVTVLPSVSVHNRLIRQYWVYTGEVWYCDADLTELLE